MSKKSFKLQNNLTCDMSSSKANNRHLLRQPRKLPCQRTACLKCVELLAESNQKFVCPFCKLEHNLKLDLSRNMMAECALDESLSDCCLHFSQRLDECLKKIKQIRAGRNQVLENLFEYVDIDIQIRIESVKSELEKSKLRMFTLLEQNANEKALKHLNKLKRWGEKIREAIKLNDYKKFCDYQAKLKKFNAANAHSNFRISLRDFETKLVRQMIGALTWIDLKKFNLNKIDPENTHAKIVRLSFHPYDISSYVNNQYLLTDSLNNCVYVMDKNFVYTLKKIDRVGSEQQNLNAPTSISYDEKNGRVFLCCLANANDLSNREILALDKQFTNILFSIENIFKSEFMHFNFDKNLVYGFSTRKLAMEEFDMKNKVFKNVKTLEMRRNGNLENANAYCVGLSDDFLAINLNNRAIQVYNISTGLFDSSIEIDDEIEGAKIHSIHFEYDHKRIYFHLNDGQEENFLYCYERKDDKNWNCLLAFSFLNSNSGSWKMKLIRESLFLTMWSQNLVYF